jgi:adenylate cyclase
VGKEIERKFLVRNDSWKKGATGKYFRQAYIYSDNGECTTRIRIAGDDAFITLKGKSVNITRAEYEYEIPVNDAKEMMNIFCSGSAVEKYRYIVMADGAKWEVDEFTGDNQGLVVAEIELPDETAQFVRPEWLGEEVSQDSRYTNACLAKKPYKNWS